MHDNKERVISGKALVVDPKKLLRPLAKFGNSSLNKFQCSQMVPPVLQFMTMADTRGSSPG